MKTGLLHRSSLQKGLRFCLILSSNTDKNVPTAPCDLGNAVTFMQDNKTLFQGYIFERQRDTGKSIINITCYDKGIYLKKNEATYKFKGITPEAITKKICADFDIDIGLIATTGVNITRNFVGVNLYRIIQTAYTLAADKTGKSYLIRFNGSKLCVVEKGITDETMIISAGNNLMSATMSESITNMVNQVAIYDDKDKLVSIQKNQELIKLYGVMQSYLKKTKGIDAIAKANKILKDNGVSQKIIINNLGNVANITGNAVVVQEPYTGLYGLFYIDSDVHTWKLGQYYNKLVLNFKNIMDEQEAGSLPNKDGSITGDWDYIYKPGGIRNG